MHIVRNGIIAGVLLLLGAGTAAQAQTSGYGSKYGSDDNSSAYTSSAPKTTAKSHVAATKKITATEVNDQYVFSPKAATVKVGTRVTWVNTSDAAHTVTSDAKAWKFDKQLGEGKRVSFVFTKAGTYAYHCKYHPGMVGTIIVKS